MKLSLIFYAYTNSYGAYEKVAKSILPLPPLNLCMIAALAEKEGWKVQLIDAEIENLSNPEIIHRLKEFKPDLIGLTATTPFFASIADNAKVLKEHLNIPIIIGGPHISIFGEQAFLDAFDYLSIGEADLVFSQFLRQFEKNPKEINVKGFISRQTNGEIFYPGDAPVPENLDELPSSARHLLKNDLYLFRTPTGVKKSTMIQITRGCPFECAFCATNLLTKDVRRRSISNVIKEIEYVVEDLGVGHIYFSDDNLTLSKTYTMDLCDEIEKRNLKFTFEGHTRADMWDEDIAKKMKRCGLIRVSFGLETAMPEIRDLIKKTVPLENYVAANRINNRLGIETMNSVMLGLPGETRELIKKTVDYLCKAKDIQNITYGITVPYPGTEIYEWADKGLYGLKLLSKDFSKFHRYGHSVLEVNGISPEEMISLQERGLIRIYSCWWRWIPMIRLHGFKALFPPMLLVIRNNIGRFFAKIKRLFFTRER